MSFEADDIGGFPIAVFDSGLGGLTVVRAIRQLLPAESVVYFGDTARLPYGSKSAATVHRFTAQCLRFLLAYRPKLVVLACNTASALALERLQGDFSVPIVGVLEPGAQAAVAAAGGGVSPVVGLIATEATIASGAYSAAIGRFDSRVQVLARACPLLVPLIEEGRGSQDPVVRLVLEEYLAPFRGLGLAALILGCTHYPLLASALSEALPGVPLIDSAGQTALVVQRRLATMRALRRGENSGVLTCYVTDQGQRFERLAARFLGGSVGQPVWVTPDMLEEEGRR